MRPLHRSRRRCVTSLCLLALLCGTATVAETPKTREPGAVAPDFALPDVRGRQVRLQDGRGKVVVLNFWAFWCDTWKAELPHLKALSARRAELGFQLLAVSVDGTRLREFQRRVGSDPPFPVLLDVGGRVSEAYGVRHVPTVVVIDAAGRVRYVKSGYPGNQAILWEIRRLTLTLPR